MLSRTALLFALGAVGIQAAEDEQARAHCIVHKVLRSGNQYDAIVSGRPFTAYYHVLNVGNAPAFDVSVSDTWPEDVFTVVEGAAKGTFKELPIGANETISITLIPKTTGIMTSKGATVTYKYRIGEEAAEGADNLDTGAKDKAADEEDEEDLVEVSSVSTSPGRFEIMQAGDYERAVVDRTTHATIMFFGALALVAYSYQWWSKAGLPLGIPSKASTSGRSKRE